MNVTTIASNSVTEDNRLVSSSQGPSEDETTTDPWEETILYLIGWCMVACLIFALAVACLLWRKCPRRSIDTDSEAGEEKGVGICVEISEEPNKKSKKRKKGKQKRNKLDEDNNNQLPGIELVAIDTAPDIITAHDSESIYETLDGRRAARANADRETAQNNQSGGSNNNGNPATSANANAADPTYDHLNRYKNRATPRALPEGATFERYTDPVVSPRPKIPQPNPRAVHSSDGVEGRGTTTRPS